MRNNVYQRQEKGLLPLIEWYPKKLITKIERRKNHGNN